MAKSYRGQTFMPTQTPEEVAAVQELNQQYDKEGAVSLDVYFSTRNIRNEVQRDMMRAYNNAGKIKRATMEDWDALFAGF